MKERIKNLSWLGVIVSELGEAERQDSEVSVAGLNGLFI